MKTLDEKLAALAFMSGNDPLVKNNEGYYTVECPNSFCAGCPFHATQCTAFEDLRSIAIVTVKVRTYKDAIALYPEAFL